MQKETTWIATQSLETSQAKIVSATFWFLSSVMAIRVSCRLGKRGFADGVVVTPEEYLAELTTSYVNMAYRSTHTCSADVDCCAQLTVNSTVDHIII
jgi:hypothetical protein